jgi:hypothetical protein
MGTVATSSGRCACCSSVIREMKCHRLACQHSHAASFPKLGIPCHSVTVLVNPTTSKSPFRRGAALSADQQIGVIATLSAREWVVVGSAIKGLTTVHAAKMGPAANVVSPSA